MDNFTIFLTLLSNHDVDKIISLLIKNKYEVKFSGNKNDVISEENNLAHILSLDIKSGNISNISLLYEDFVKLLNGINCLYYSIFIIKNCNQARWSIGNVTSVKKISNEQPYR